MDRRHLKVSYSSREGVAELGLVGEVDLGTAALVRDALDRVLRSGCREVVINGERLSYLDSSGLHCLVSAAEKADAAGISFRMSGLSGLPLRVLEIAGLEDRLFDGRGSNVNRSSHG